MRKDDTILKNNDIPSKLLDGNALSYLPAAFISIVSHDRTQDHQLGAAAFQQGYLILLTQGFESDQLFSHLDNTPDGNVGQIDDIKKGRVSGIVLQLKSGREEGKIKQLLIKDT